MRKIKILGAGISGLTAAINLSKAGFKVEVFEKNPDCGMRFHGDMQGLENWSDEEDVLDSLKHMNININFEVTPFRRVVLTNCKSDEEFSFDKPLFYLITRGKMKGSLDQGLKEQALSANVEIRFNSTIEPEKADIVSTGPHPPKRVVAVDKGIIFKTDLSDIAVCVANDQAAYRGYAYLIVANGNACLCTGISNGAEKLNDCFEFTKSYFSKKYNLKIKNPLAVGGIANYSFNNRFKKGKTLFTGEAAGIQDFLWGFGMRTAFSSGHLAALSIIEKKSYKEMTENKYRDYLKAGIVNRYNWEHVGIDNFSYLLKNVNKKVNGTDFSRSIYNFNLVQQLEYPVALGYIKKNYPEVF